ncbi:MAG: tRNA pseudouridine(13) synthase TruD [Phycisphaerae bacterium]|nr:tRNA pseudouridine(13) synthase TruD [Phycisphaerae bacterium]
MVIRRTPDDFRVIERLVPAVAEQVRADRPDARWIVFELTKRSMTTPDAVAQLARRLGVPPGACAHAGLKDKHAVTVQHVAVARARIRSAGSASDRIEAGQWCARRIGSLDLPLASGSVEVNEFTIVLRGLNDAESAALDRRAAARADGDGVLVPNYYGSQRFGSGRHGEGLPGERLVRGDFEGALRLAIGTPARKDSGSRRVFTRRLAAGWGAWSDVLPTLPPLPDRRAIEALSRGEPFASAYAALPYYLQELHVDAFQSLLWNRTAARLLGRATPAELEDDPELPFPAHAQIPPEFRGLDLPALAPGVSLAEPWGDAAASVLRRAGLALEQLRVPGFRRPAFANFNRALVVVARGFRATPPEPDEAAKPRSSRPLKRTLSFQLPRGSYATVLVEALAGRSGDPGD